MLSAVLKIKPQIDQNDAKKMERSLFDRFKNIGRTAKKTLKDVVTGGFLGFAVGLAQSMLSPIEEVETRMKSMLDRATELKDMAEQFNTSSGKMQALQTNALTNGMKPEQLKAMMMAFRETVDAAEEQILKKQPLDEKTSIVKGFVGSKDMAEAFFNFVQGLRLESAPVRDRLEKDLFGSVQYGGAARFIQNAGVVSSISENPNVAATTGAVDKLDKLNSQYQINESQKANQEMINYAVKMNGKFLDTMIAWEDRQKKKELNQLDQYQQMASARITIDRISGVLENTIVPLLTKLVNYVGQFLNWLEKSPMGKGFLKTIGVR